MAPVCLLYTSRLTVSDVNYEMYASTAVDTDKITDTIALASAAKAFKEDKASQYQKSLDFLEAMVSAAEFRDISEDWLKSVSYTHLIRIMKKKV